MDEQEVLKVLMGCGGGGRSMNSQKLMNLSSLLGKEPNTKGKLLGVEFQIRQIRDNISRGKKVQMTVGEEKTELRNDQGMKVSFYENIRKGSSGS